MEDAPMIFKTAGRRVEVEYERGDMFFVRLPLRGDLLWTNTFGWEYWPWSDVKAHLEREDAQRRKACAA
jgi:hypothetical protein